MRKTVGAAVLAMLPLFACAGGATGAPIDGDWAGWVYLDEGGDLPLRFGLRLKNGSPTATLDSPVEKRFDLPVQVVEWNKPHLRLERVSDSGNRMVFEGTLDGDTIAGRADLAGSPADFEIHRSPERLADIDPDSYADCQGSYVGAETTIVVGSRFWGELLFTDTRSGREGTLFPAADGTFFAGSAMYVPGTIHARARFVRDAAGVVTSLEWTETGGAPWFLERRAFVEEEVSFASGDTRLAGTLILPAAGGPFPAIAVLGGSYWDARGALRPEASVFASFGLAVLIYDQRGHGESGGDATAPFAVTAADAAAAVRWLEARDDVRDDRVGLSGRSRGGWFAPLAASIEPAVDFLVLFVAPAVSPAEQESVRRLNRMRDEGYDADTLRAAERLLEATWRYGRTGIGWEEYAAERGRAVEAGVPDYVMETDSSADEDWRWIRLNMHYDPVPALEKVTCPVLGLFGGADRNVVPAINMPRMREALGGNPDVTLIELEDADHGLRVVGSDGADVPPHRKVGVAEAAWSTVRDWIAAHVADPA